ncbi:MBL fold metallo-hydrolase [Deinococcus taeanensis]|uniref:MBL fold metallo-hydrolase n=1 Tax=Deinococcus taeanensis TaxID=2737050 RepID=UPI001CDD702B|nr:MBL fold metallo-hydrolase [Deinococcus taeanensis]UBV43164.1 MBL fold metallo-hydrolase [Deinococcus taeanensis]
MSERVRVVPLQAGACLNLAGITERGAPWRVQAYPAGFALLLHPTRGPVLFDTGYGAGVLSAMKRWPGVLYGLVTPVRLLPGEAAWEQLQFMGFAPGDVQHVIVSHLHADHVGGLRDFPNATFHLDRRAWAPLRALRGVRAVRRAFLPELLPEDFEARARWLDFRAAPPGLHPFAQVADVFGDGLVQAVPLPGHAPGMTGLLVEESAGLTVLAADAAWSTRAARQQRPVHPLARVAFHDVAQEARSGRVLRAFLHAHPGARLHVSHDAAEPWAGTGTHP